MHYLVYIKDIKIGDFEVTTEEMRYTPDEKGVKEAEEKGLLMLNLLKRPISALNIEFFSSIINNCNRFNNNGRFGYHSNNIQLIEK